MRRGVLYSYQSYLNANFLAFITCSGFQHGAKIKIGFIPISIAVNMHYGCFAPMYKETK